MEHGFTGHTSFLSPYHHTHTHPFNGPLSGTTQVSRYQKGKTNLDFTEAKDSEWQWHQLGHMQVCTLLKTDNHASTPQLSFLQAGCPSCRPTNSVRALKAHNPTQTHQCTVKTPNRTKSNNPDCNNTIRDVLLATMCDVCAPVYSK